MGCLNHDLQHNPSEKPRNAVDPWHTSQQGWQPRDPELARVGVSKLTHTTIRHHHDGWGYVNMNNSVHYRHRHEGDSCHGRAGQVGRIRDNHPQ